MTMPMKKRRIAVFTGKRGGFGAMLKIMQGIAADPNLELKVIASDMHLSQRFGSTIDEVRGHIAVDATVDLGDYGSRPVDRAQALGRCIEGLAGVLDAMRPDILLLLGDRGETLAAAMCAVELGIVVAHIQAGDISGGIDDIHRHSITKLAHLHFSQNETQRQRVIRLGEAPERVWNTGAPYVDNILSHPIMPRDEALRSLGLPVTGDYFVILQHPDSYRPEVNLQHTTAILEAVKDRDERSIIVYPCSDPGYGDVVAALESYRQQPNFHFFKSIDAFVFLGLVAGSKALIGNSSGGIIEAPYLRVPFVNVGLRQECRETAANVISCEGTVEAIHAAIERTADPSFRSAMLADRNRFGDGRASERILEVLRTAEITPKLFRKRITY